MTQRYDVLVLGGGHNGLVAAHYLAAGGLSVAVLERRPVFGGICGPLTPFPGYRCAVSNSPGSLEPKIVSDMALGDHGLKWVRPDPTLVMPFPDGRAFIGWRDREKADQSFNCFSPNDAEGYRNFIDYYDRFAQRLGLSLFEPAPPLAALEARMTTAEDRAAFKAIMGGSVRDLLDRFIESDEIKVLAGLLSLTNCNSGPSSIGTAMTMILRPLSLYSNAVPAEHDPRRQPLRGSTGLPLGGMGSIPDAMVRSLQASGVTLRNNAAVAGIRVTSAGAVKSAVLSSGEEIDTRAVISNINTKTTLLDLLEPGRLPDDIQARMGALPMNGGAFKLVLGLSGLPRMAAAPPGMEEQIASCQFRIAPSLDYLEDCWRDAQAGRPSRAPMFWGLVPSVTDPTMAPPGKHIMSLNIWYAPYHLAEGNWDQEKDRFIANCIRILSDYFPNLPDIIEQVRGWSPVDLEEEFGLLEGHQLHGDMTPERMFGDRPISGLGHYRTPVDGLYISGAGTWPGGFVTGLPGHNAAQQLLSDLAAGRPNGPR